MNKIIIGFFIIFSISFGDYIKEWDGILKEYVTKGSKQGMELTLVNYRGVARDPRWNSILKELKSYDPSNLKGDDHKAFWINAYNIGAFKMIIDNYPLKSIRDVGNLIKPVWNRSIIDIGGTTYTLGNIEHDILRKTGDPDIHYAIVCASISCPDLRLEPYYSSSLEKQLRVQKNIFLDNTGKGVRVEGNTYYISSLFKWYKDDFGDPKKYLGLPKDSKIKFLKYNWSLNEK